MNLKRTSGKYPLEIFFKNTLFTIKWQKHRCIQQGIEFVYVKVTHVLENHYNNESIITKLGHTLHIVFHLIKRSAPVANGNSPNSKENSEIFCHSHIFKCTYAETLLRRLHKIPFQHLF